MDRATRSGSHRSSRFAPRSKAASPTAWSRSLIWNTRRPTSPALLTSWLQRGATMSIKVVPLFLGPGGHVRGDVPQLIERATRQTPARGVRCEAVYRRRSRRARCDCRLRGVLTKPQCTSPRRQHLCEPHRVRCCLYRERKLSAFRKLSAPVRTWSASIWKTRCTLTESSRRAKGFSVG